MTVRGGSVTWRDDTTAPQATLVLRDVVLDASAIALPFAQPLQFSGTAALAGVAPALVAPSARAAIMTFSGSATDQAATVNATVKEVPLTLPAPYLAQHIKPALGGILSTELAVDWKPSELPLAVKLLTLDNLALVQKPAKNVKSAPALASLKKLEIVDSRIELGPQTITVGKLSLDQLKASVERGSDGRWMFERWMKPLAAPQTRQASTAPARDAKEAKAPQAKRWTVGVADASLNATAFTYLDQTTPKPVSFEVSAIKAQVKSFSTDAKKPFPLSLSARIRAPQGEPGKLDYRGNLGLLPLAAQGKVVATQIPVHAFEPYFGDALNIELLRADVGFKGDVRFVNGARGPQVKVTGDSVLEEFRANSTVAKLTGATAPADSGPPAGGAGTAGDLKISEELLSWKALSLRGVDVSVEPGLATAVSFSETALSDFFARVLINETGRINLQDLVKSVRSLPTRPIRPIRPTRLTLSSISAPSVWSTAKCIFLTPLSNPTTQPT